MRKKSVLLLNYVIMIKYALVTYAKSIIACNKVGSKQKTSFLGFGFRFKTHFNKVNGYMLLNWKPKQIFF